MSLVEGSLIKLRERLDQERKAIKDKEEESIKQWLLELQSAGNVRYVSGTEECPWYKPCVELVTSRFMANGIAVSIRVHVHVHVNDMHIYVNTYMLVSNIFTIMYK